MQPVITPAEQAADDGRHYTAGHIFLAVADNADVELRITLPATRRGRFTLVGSSDGNFECRLFEDTTFTVAGTPITPANNNRSGAPVASLILVKHTPTVDVDGTELFQAFVPGGTGGNASGRVAVSDVPWVLSEGKEYLIRLTNTSGTASDFTIAVGFAEDGTGL